MRCIEEGEVWGLAALLSEKERKEPACLDSSRLDLFQNKNSAKSTRVKKSKLKLVYVSCHVNCV